MFGKVNIDILNGQIDRTIPSEDGISALLSYNSNITEFSIKRYTSIFDINDDWESADYDAEKYQAAEFFKQNPGGQLWLAFAPTGATYDYTEILKVMRETNGDVKRLAILSGSDISTIATDIAEIKARQNTLVSEFKPYYNILLAVDITSYDIDQLAAIDDLRDGTYDNRWLTPVVGTNADDENCIGATLGIISRLSVEEHPGHVGPNNLTANSAEWDSPKLGETDVVNITEVLLEELHNKGYLFIRKFPAFAGSYVSGFPVTTSLTDDFRKGTDTAVIYKAFRGVYLDMLPLVNSKVKQTDGEMDSVYRDIFEETAKRTPNGMLDAEEISDFKVLVPRGQDVISTGTVNINMAIVPYGHASVINVTLGLAVKV